MSVHRSAPTRAIQSVVKGREIEILDGLDIDWKSGQPHIACPYPTHDDDHPSWRWDDKKARAFCTCIERSHSIFDVVMAKEEIDFAGAKIRVAEMLGRKDLIQDRSPAKSGHYQAVDAESLLNVPADQRDDILPGAYLAHRLSAPVEEVPMPSTPTVGLKSLGYFDPSPEGSKAKSKLVGNFPCAVFGTASVDGRTHAHRIYLLPEGAGKADLGTSPDGHPRAAKKSAKVLDGVSRAGCAVLWGDPSRAPHLLLTEGIETGAAVACAHREDLDAGNVAVAAAVMAGGVEAFQPYLVTQRITVCADRDEAEKPNGNLGSRRGEKAARKFGILNHERVKVEIALPGESGETVDWLDEMLRVGPAGIKFSILFASDFEPTEGELKQRFQERTHAAELKRAADTYPLPHMDSLDLIYAYTRTGKIKVHKVVGLRTDPISGVTERQAVPVATPFGISARLRYADQHDAYGLRCVVQDMNGEPRAVDFDRAELPKLNASEIRSKLFAAGLRTEADGELIAVQCLKAADPEREIVVYRRPGWQEIAGAVDPVFICPSGEVIGAPEGLTLELAASARMDAEIAVAGTFEGWQDAIAAAVSATRCPHWMLGILAGFVGPLVSLTGLDTCGINLSGLSSSGKSTAQRLAVSAWSTPDIRRSGLAQSARATDNAVEALAERATGTVLSLDELAHIPGKVTGRIIYVVAGSVGKRRMKSDATMRDSYSWSTFAVLSGESSLEEKIRADGGEWTAGMAVRIVDVDVTGVDRNVDRETLDLIDQVTRNYGHAGPAFVRAMIAHGLHRQPTTLRARIMTAGHEITGDSVDSAKVRASIPFALLLIAGELGKALGIIPECAAITDAVNWAWNRFQQSTESLALDPEAQAVANLHLYVAAGWDVTIKSIEPGGGYREAVGWYDKTAVYIPKERMQEATGNALKNSHIGPVLDRRGFLAKRPERDRYCVGWVPKVGSVTCYALSRSEFGRSDAVIDPGAVTVVQAAADD